MLSAKVTGRSVERKLKPGQVANVVLLEEDVARLPVAANVLEHAIAPLVELGGGNACLRDLLRPQRYSCAPFGRLVVP